MSKITTTQVNNQKIDWLIAQPIEVQLSIVSQHMQIVQLVLNSILESEVSQLTGEKYSRNRPHSGRYNRWGSNPGSIKIGGEKIKMAIPRVYDQVSDLSLIHI